MLRCKRRHLGYLGFSDVSGIDAAYGGTLIMYLEHDLRRTFLSHRKKYLQDFYYKLHRGEIVIQQNHLVKLGRLGFAPFQQVYVFLLGCHCSVIFTRCMATYLTISSGFSSQFVNKLCLTLDVISSSAVKSARVFESEYLQCWFCHVRSHLRSWNSNNLTGVLPSFFVRM
jgi:hypothetical protein